MTTNFKAVKRECNEIRKKVKALNDLFLKGLSKVRQPVESLFNLLTKKNIQRTCKVKLTKGLLPQSVCEDCSCLYKLNILTRDSRNLVNDTNVV